MLLERSESVSPEWLEMIEVEQQYERTADFTPNSPITNNDNINIDRRQQVFDALVKDNYI